MQKFSYAVVILSYNHPELTEKTLKSVIALSFPLEQIFLVHNGSLPKHQDFLVSKFPDLNHLCYTDNKGYSGGANRGLQEAFKYYEHIFFITNDTEVIQLPFDFPKNTDLFSPLIFKRQSDQIDSCMGQLNLKNGRLTHLRTQSAILETQKNTFLKIYAPGTAIGLSRSCFYTTAGFDERFHTYWEDVDFSLRAQEKKFLLISCNEFQLRHKIGKTCHKDRFYTLYLFQRNRKKVLSRFGTHKFLFLISFLKDMFFIFIKLIPQKENHKYLKLWWKALYD